MKPKQPYLIFGLLSLILILTTFVFLNLSKVNENITEEQNPISQTRPIDKELEARISEKSNLIIVTHPLPNQEISSPLKITGQARGYWFFEASFPVFLTDWDGKIIAQGIAQAKDDWMTENFVPFEVELSFIKPDYGQNGTLIFKKDNPSGMPEHDDALEIPIFFSQEY